MSVHIFAVVSISFINAQNSIDSNVFQSSPFSSSLSHPSPSFLSPSSHFLLFLFFFFFFINIIFYFISILVPCLLGLLKYLASPLLWLLGLFFKLSMSVSHHIIQHHQSSSSYCPPPSINFILRWPFLPPLPNPIPLSLSLTVCSRALPF